jgi:acetoin utilization protein AcuB
MTQNPISISPTYTLQDALLMIQDARVGALPVVDGNGILSGIISVRDLLRAFINVLGIGEPGTLLCILAEEKRNKSSMPSPKKTSPLAVYW